MPHPLGPAPDPPNPPNWVRLPQPVNKCLTPDCKQDEATAYKRGLCVKCHSSAKKLIEAGRTTWEILAEMGLARKQENDDPFTRAFNRFNSEQPQAMEG